MHVPSIPQPAIPVKVQLPDGNTITCFIFLEGNRLHVDTIHYGCFVLDRDGIREAAERILEITGEKQ
jgi:hypothetical protein